MGDVIRFLRRKSKSERYRNGESGNVLFLILIAVALFAALSYAVTNSSRGGGTDAGRETSEVNVAQILSVPTAYRMAAQRMMISKGMDAGEIVASRPESFDTSSAAMNKANIYHPTGGGMPYPLPPKNLIDPAYDGDWVLNSENEVKNIGSTSTSGAAEESSVDVMVFLPGLKQSVCAAINAKLGITSMPVSFADYSLIASGDPGIIMENGGYGIIGRTSGQDDQLAGKSEACFQSSADPKMYVFYAVIVER